MSSSIRDLKHRVKTVRSINQVTSAMKTVAVSKYNRARTKESEFSQYRDACIRLASWLSPENNTSLKRKDAVLYIAAFSNRGLCGTYNTDLLEELVRVLNEEKREKTLVLIGRWAAEHIKPESVGQIAKTFVFSDIPKDSEAGELTALVKDYWNKGEVSEVFFISQSFKNIMSHKPQTAKLLPIEKNESGLSETEYIFEPSKEAVTEGLYDLCLQADVYGLLLQVAEGAFGAMMVAMRQAADNSGDVLDALTLNLNRMRQAQITTQVIEVSSSLTGGNEI
ncbi:MAG: F0F1 ATP synthase subunit gamma [Oscillospiraceae bacterium]|jgi:F-type H+-transporting ATPase subunit gamma|nr:F0F1 ATP synthase subunit gamma [Oscillospiraceae bacterium]MBQ2146523.1 F0F1 ATP synthase subunit gamma [Oscillospiraceae bacterium]MBQ5489239.1 F0F1 ATP synthase subunit gamma [Oscillospiraceae bacterium]